MNKDLEHAKQIANSYDSDEITVDDIITACMDMARWKDEQLKEKSVDLHYLTSWYISSIDETVPPIWTNEHFEELLKDFYLIPKNND